MVTREENEQLTGTDAGTPGGELMRRYWEPVALAEELPEGGAPLPVRVLGEDLVLFRDEQAQPALLGIHCSHRGADLSYGRLEDGGLRCIYHGWLYDAGGRCLEQPGEPAGSTFHEKIQHRAYPCQELGGLILAYMGPGSPPQLPRYEFLEVPDDHRFVTKIFHDCNYLQGNEGNIDSQHLSFLHRIFDESEVSHAARDVAPLIEPEDTDYGMRMYVVRTIGLDLNYVKINNFIMPNLTAFPGGPDVDGYSVNWHVAIDDTHHWKYVIQFRRSAPMEKATVARGRADLTADYRLHRNLGNRYLQDRAEMETRTFSGMGRAFQVHDACATEGQGAISDRTSEHLGATDRAVIAARKRMLDGIQDIQEGREPPNVLRDPTSDWVPDINVTGATLPISEDWHHFWKRADEAAAARA